MSHSAIADAPAELAATPWIQRIAERPPWTPWRLALAISLALAALFLAVEWLFDRIPLVLGSVQSDWTEDAQINFRLTLPLILLAGYLPAAFADAARGARQAIADVMPSLREGAAEALGGADAGRFDPVALRRAGWIGIAVVATVPLWIDRDLGAWFVWRYGPESIVQRLLLLPTGWFGARLFYAVAVESQRLSRAGALACVDLLDLRSFAPITRQALRHSLLILGLLSILSLYFFDYEKRGLLPVIASVAALALGGAATALLVPLRGSRRAIQAAKRAELDWCETGLRRMRASPENAAPGARSIADLVAWRELVLAVPEWPLDAPTLRRFGLYLVIPLGSWLGGALVDRAVESSPFW